MKTGILLLVVAGAVLIGSVLLVRSAARLLFDPMHAETVAQQHIDGSEFKGFELTNRHDNGQGEHWFIFRSDDRRVDVTVRKVDEQWTVIKASELRDKAAAALR